MNKRIKIIRNITLVTILTLFLLISALEITRNLNYKQLDDVHPQMNCEEKYIQKGDVLMIMPLWQNDSIANYPDWCKEILSYNKTLGLHGIYHTYNEFLGKISEEELKLAIDEFEKCFGKSPELFEPPQWKISSENRVLVERYLPVTNDLQGIFHKTYHCENEGESFRFLGIKITNKLIDWI
jgi:predicted deacetylase